MRGLSLAPVLVDAKGKLGPEDTVQRNKLIFWKDNPGCFVGTDHVRDREWLQIQVRQRLQGPR